MRYSAVQPSESIRGRRLPDRVPGHVLVAVVVDRVVGLHPGRIDHELVAGAPVVVGIEHEDDLVRRGLVVAAGEQADDAVGPGIEGADEDVEMCGRRRPPGPRSGTGPAAPSLGLACRNASIDRRGAPDERRRPGRRAPAAPGRGWPGRRSPPGAPGRWRSPGSRPLRSVVRAVRRARQSCRTRGQGNALDSGIGGRVGIGREGRRGGCPELSP